MEPALRISVVVTSGLGTVATADEEEMLDGTGLNTFDNLVSYTEDAVTGETAENLAVVSVSFETGKFLCLCDYFSKVTVDYVGNSGPAYEAGGVDIALVAFNRLLNAVGGHEDCTGELCKFLGLILPCGSVMSVEMVELLQFGITMAGQHFAVGINIDSGTFGLLEKLAQILKIVTGTRMALPALAPRGTSVGTG